MIARRDPRDLPWLAREVALQRQQRGLEQGLEPLIEEAKAFIGPRRPFTEELLLEALKQLPDNIELALSQENLDQPEEKP